MSDPRPDRRPFCVRCGQRVDRMQRCIGAVIAYPCLCWLTAAQVGIIAAAAMGVRDE